MKHFIILLTLVLVFVNTKAQLSEDSVKVTINAFFETMNNADSAAASNIFSSTAILQTISEHPQKGVSVQNQSVANFTGSLNKVKKGMLDERIVFSDIKIDGPLAFVWTPYQFYYNGQFSHCGVNSFQLVRFADGWKIQYVIDTRRKDYCN